MRILLPAIVAGVALGFLGTAFADDTASDTAVASPITYSSDDGITCHHLVHEGEITSVVGCRDKAGWERQRHATEQAILEFQIRSLVKRR